MSRWLAALAVVALTSAPAMAQDVKTVLANASKAMGVDGLNSVHYYGVAADFTVGQNNNANGAWPRRNLDDYDRTIDFTQPASRATAVTYAVPVTGGAATQGAFNQNITPANNTWAQQLEIWTTPWGFIKGAMANNATARSQTVNGKRYTEVTWMTTQKAPSGASYKVVGYINPQTNLVEKVDTWLDHPFFGDMYVENLFTEYRDGNGGVKFPSTIQQKRVGRPTFEFQVLAAFANPSNLQQLMTPPARGGGPGGPAPGGAGAGRGAPPAGAPPAGGAPGAGRGGPGGPGGPGAGAPAPASEKLADGVWRINGAYNALAVEFSDHVVLFEPGPQNEARALEVIAETKKVIPNKPIRFGVISHHHLDHTQGLPAAVAEGITIVTPEVNKAYITSAMSAPRTLAPDVLSKSGKKPVVEGFTGDKRVFQDSTRTFEIHVIRGLPHADGLVVGYLPKERILVYADMFNLPTEAAPVPNPPVVGTGVFADNIVRLNLQPERILSVHNLNPNRLATLDDIFNSLGRKRN
jgi:glyoxylase-like metal-dependent hydrolase (beta-lactamase superfamily II)